MAIFDRERYLDRRTFKRHIKRGTLTEEQYKQSLAGLPDMTENIMDKEEGGDEDGYEQRVVAAAEQAAAEAAGGAPPAEGDAAAAAPPAAPAEGPSGYGTPTAG